ncbi:MAG TPA: ATP-binding protein, partial [Anaerolineales bacterium]|nr:ATP-binding protein [Anaerolineales bacterium]
ANYCLAQGKPVLFLNTPDLLDYLRATYAPSSQTTYDERFDEVRTAPILILDDLGTESPTNWAIEKLYQLLNYRYNARLPTIITTNRDLKDIDQRIASRLSDVEIVSALSIAAPDFRAGKLIPASDISTLSVHSHQTFERLDLRPELTGEARQKFISAIHAAKEFAEAPRGWIVFIGHFGSGKTHLAAAIANHRAQMGRPVIFTTYQDLRSLFRFTKDNETEERNEKLIQQVKTTELLILDDIPNLAVTTGYFRDRFFQVFNYRFDARLPTVLTTSLAQEELDERIKSRLFLTEYCKVNALLGVPAYHEKKKAGKKK